MKLLHGVMFLCMGLIGCAGQRELKNDRDFFKQSVIEQIRSYPRHSVDEQLKLYFYGNQRRHPPATYLADCFALNGLHGVERIRVTLSGPLDDLTTRDIVALLSAMEATGQYNVRDDHELMNVAVKHVEGMGDPNWREVAQSDLDSIRHKGRRYDGATACRI
ncbi:MULTISPECIES: hypothetical protein [Dyella]|uniref:Uncharacterized protein n=2 Tax=Dyella TaxID=231454 RepID=A0A4R0YIB9_9GAMM|nr:MULTISPECIES: hypothetical protein [Dyella]TBR36727.1 hypothetical protein EYV96_12480 [Dyella terrae]TCI08182.1 hypothetical protein EZM97_26390 [Dyella soli]